MKKLYLCLDCGALMFGEEGKHYSCPRCGSKDVKETGILKVQWESLQNEKKAQIMNKISEYLAIRNSADSKSVTKDPEEQLNSEEQPKPENEVPLPSSDENKDHAKSQTAGNAIEAVQDKPQDSSGRKKQDKSKKRKIILRWILGFFGLLVVLFVISCNIKLPKLEAECKKLEDRYFEAGYTDLSINNVILGAYNFGRWETLYEDMGHYISMVMIISPIDKLFLKFSSESSIKKYWKYLE